MTATTTADLYQPHRDRRRPEHQSPFAADEALDPAAAETGDEAEQRVRREHARREHRPELKDIDFI